MLLSVYSPGISIGFMATCIFFSCKSSPSGCFLRSILLSVHSSGISVGFMLTSAFFSCKSSSSGCLLRSLLLSVYSSGISVGFMVTCAFFSCKSSSSGCLLRSMIFVSSFIWNLSWIYSYQRLLPLPRFCRNGKIEQKIKNPFGKGFRSKMTAKKLIPVYIESNNDFLYFL